MCCDGSRTQEPLATGNLAELEGTLEDMVQDWVGVLEEGDAESESMDSGHS